MKRKQLPLRTPPPLIIAGIIYEPYTQLYDVRVRGLRHYREG